MAIFEERGITQLDLHGIKHEEVNSEILNFVYQFQDLLPLYRELAVLELVSKGIKSFPKVDLGLQ